MPLLPSLREVFQSILTFLHIDPASAGRKFLAVALIWAIAWAANRLVGQLADRIVAAADDGNDDVFDAAERRSATIAGLLRSLGTVLVVLLAGLLTLNLFISIGPILAGAGVLGLAVSFGAQSLVKDVIAGFFILLENQFAVGDTIEVAGAAGTVELMTLRIVQLRDIEGVLHTIPNGQIQVVSNKTRLWSRAVVDVGIAYEASVDGALAVFADEARAFAADAEWGARLDGEPDVVGVQSLADSAVVVRTLLRTRPGDQWATAREFRRRVKNRLDREGIEIPFPQRTIHVRQGQSTTDAVARAAGEVA
ncbi:MAG TPA: mechanosensitive ion channel family protein [Gemmatimonadales bacterium]|nr:mechanosensitive ion channel family protein [Gemmatimonadales bacterium]